MSYQTSLSRSGPPPPKKGGGPNPLWSKKLLRKSKNLSVFLCPFLSELIDVTYIRTWEVLSLSEFISLVEIYFP